MVKLRMDCEIIFKKRSDIVQSVVAKQNKNVQNVEKVCACINTSKVDEIPWVFSF
jgi:hypothetical protein